MHKFYISVLSVVACFGLAAMGAGAFASEDPPARDPHAPTFASTASTLDDEPTVDLSGAATLPYTTREVTIVASPHRAAKAPQKGSQAPQTGKVWVCGASREVNEGTTVRPCEWRNAR